MRLTKCAREVPTNHLRKEVWNKTSGFCWYCGNDLRKWSDMHVDHVQPVSKGGVTVLANLVPACFSCNSDKGKMDLDEYRRHRAKRTAYPLQYAFQHIEDTYLDDDALAVETKDRLKALIDRTLDFGFFFWFESQEYTPHYQI